MTLDLAFLSDFQALAETGNFSRAAVLRNVTQPAFSRRIRLLEDWVGAPLFDRDLQPIRLTPAGQAFKPVVTEMLRRLGEGRAEALAAAGRADASLLFAATHVLSFTFFPSWLRGLETGQPLGPVQLVSDSLSACERLMLEGRAQFLLCHHHAAAPVRLGREGFSAIRVGADRLLPVAAPDLQGAPRHALAPGDAGPLPYLGYDAESGLGRIIAALLPDAVTARLDTVFTSHLAAALRTMAATGRGIAWLPESLVAEDLAAGRLLRCGPEALDIALDINLIRAARDLGAAAERFWARLDAAGT